MKRNQLSHFVAQAIPTTSSSRLVGGTSFCDWYMNLCSQNGTQIDQKVMDFFMQKDSVYGNSIPSTYNLSNLYVLINALGG